MSKISNLESTIVEVAEVTITKDKDGNIEFVIGNLSVTFKPESDFVDVMEDIGRLCSIYMVALEENFIDATKEFAEENPEFYN